MLTDSFSRTFVPAAVRVGLLEHQLLLHPETNFIRGGNRSEWVSPSFLPGMIVWRVNKIRSNVQRNPKGHWQQPVFVVPTDRHHRGRNATDLHII